MSVIAEYGHILLILACVFGVFMAWGIGANDVANAMGTSVGSRALTMRQAICVAMVFEFLGAYLAGGEVTATIRSGIVNSEFMNDKPDLLVFGMLSSLLAAGCWLLLASIMGWPVSTTHSLVGAIIGFAAVGISMDAVAWSSVTSIVSSWVISPVIAGFIAFWIFRSVQHLILDTEDPFTNAKRYIPFYMFAVGFLISMVTILKGLSHVLKDSGIQFTFGQSTLIALVVAGIVTGVGVMLLRRVTRDAAADAENRYASVERVFGILMIFTACAMAFAHGSNDVSNAVGPMAAVIDIINSGEVHASSPVPSWVLLLGAVGIVIGLLTYGWKVIMTIGKKITELTPSRGFAAEMAAAATVIVASGTGMPLSTTHTLVGAVLGVGLARGIGALNLGVIGKIFLSWIITLPAGAGLSILFFFFFKGVFT
ncbi:inorganic phosphate transporter [Cellvibrio polysaccharolyticus]|uniref:Phosphate transporter n=1 Tax=Cellvibrio polysaccharolyticus TaxID=2082724 RepID=A0A928V3G1_9GAMM|nr:inorganic phosphate transporter [Cellvibrio polysaccharolyticus]MBE8716226.1 anion permease [Cellvibrio polysaccharolyticus]